MMNHLLYILTSNGNEITALGHEFGLDLEARIVMDELVLVRVGDHLVTGENA